MNSRSGVNETNLVNFSTDLPTLNQLEPKDGLLTFPFDHIYACHSGAPERRALQLEKEVEIATHCIVPPDPIPILTGDVGQKLAVAEGQNRRLKDLLIYHLDLIQQQNDLLSKREKIYNTLKQENDSLKTLLNDRLPTDPNLAVNPALVSPLPSTSTVTSTVVSGDADITAQVNQIMLNSFSELLLPDNSGNPYLFDTDLLKTKPFLSDPFELPPLPPLPSLPSLLSLPSLSPLPLSTLPQPQPPAPLPTPAPAPAPVLPDVINFLPPEPVAPVEPKRAEKVNMIENKRSYAKKEVKPEPRQEALYTVTSNSGNPVIQRIQRNRRKPSTGIGSLSRMTKNPVKVDTPPDTAKAYPEPTSLERTFSVNKKPKMISTFSKGKGVSTISKKTMQFTGSLSDRLQLIDTTPTGEDPYQLGEADMREQSPIPKLMLQKSNHSRMKICPETGAPTGRRIYEPPSTVTSKSKIKLDSCFTRVSTPATPSTSTNKSYSAPSAYKPAVTKEAKTAVVPEPVTKMAKTETTTDWRTFNPKPRETSLCDFSYGETSSNLATGLLPSLDSVDFQDFFNSDSLNLALEPLLFNSIKAPEKPKKRGGNKTTSGSLLHSSLPPYEPQEMRSLGVAPTATATSSTISTTTASASTIGDDTAIIPPPEVKKGTSSNRGRKRAYSATGVAKVPKPKPPPKPRSTRGKAACRGKRSPVAGRMTRRPYHTLVGDPDLSWYLGLDPELKAEDVDPPADCKRPTVEVPRWREKPYTSCYTMEGTENVDDRVYEKRHQKLEAEERRQLRWHMRRIREQRHVERLRQRQRVAWAVRPPVFSVWPRPREARFIEITDALPVIAFGESMPDLPTKDFMLPWVRTSKALKRSKRSKTLH